MPNLVLLGDSIFDNSAYTAGGPDVVTQVRQRLPAGWKATLLAVDGAVTLDVPGQLRNMPGDASHLVLSVGGNDALMQIGVLDVAVKHTAQAVGHLADVVAIFENVYRATIAGCLRAGLPLTVCTIYNGNFQDPSYQRVISTTVALFNDVIIRVALANDLPVIDLRAICSEPGDYANPIEPSSLGGAKIARILSTFATGIAQPDRKTTLVGA